MPSREKSLRGAGREAKEKDEARAQKLNFAGIIRYYRSNGIPHKKSN
jgi:hypothetical protein